MNRIAHCLQSMEVGTSNRAGGSPSASQPPSSNVSIKRDGKEKDGEKLERKPKAVAFTPLALRDWESKSSKPEKRQRRRMVTQSQVPATLCVI